MKNSPESLAPLFKELNRVHRRPVDSANHKNCHTLFSSLTKINLQQFCLFGEKIIEGIWIVDNQGQTVYMNTSMATMLGYSEQEKERILLSDCLDAENLKSIHARIPNCANTKLQPLSIPKPLAFRQKDGSIFWGTVTVNHIFGFAKRCRYILMMVSDLSGSKPVEERLAHLNRMYSVISHTHRAIIQIRSLPELCREICRILVKDGLFKLVWIGMVDFETNQIELIAHCESDLEFPVPVRLPDLNNPDPRNQEIIADIRAGNTVVVNDLENDLHMLPWRADALQRGCRSFIVLPVKVYGKVIGTVNIYAATQDFFNEEEKELLTDLVDNLSYAIEFIKQEQQRQNAQNALKESEERLQDSYRHLNKVMIEIVKSFATTIETRDPYTAGHQDRVSKLALAIAQEMGLPAAQIDAIILAATIHDIGKLFVPSEILNKPGKISENEYNLIKTHPQIGYDIIKEIEFTWPIAEIILQHHERLDGSGYPNKIAGDLILLEAKIIGVADVVEAMASHRPYRPALGIDRALEEISRNQGVLYDPVVVEVCIDLLKRVKFGFE